MIRRIKKDLQSFFNKQKLTDKEQHFIDRCISFQYKHPQLTSFQWQIIEEIELKYKTNPNPRILE